MQSRVVDWNMVKKGEDGVCLCPLLPSYTHPTSISNSIIITCCCMTSIMFVFMVAEEEKKLNATYIISVARKLGCTVFLLPEDIMEVRQECEFGFHMYKTETPPLLKITTTVQFQKPKRAKNKYPFILPNRFSRLSSTRR